MPTHPTGLRLGALSCALFLASACAGGSGTSTVPGPSLSPSPTARSGALRATITITILNKTTSSARARAAAGGRRAAYVSPATQSAQIVILSGTTTVFSQSLPLGPNAYGCSASLASTVCQVLVQLVPGTYDITMTAYDGPVVDGVATGTALSAAHVPFTVAQGSPNNLALVLGGIPVTVLIAPLGNQPWISGNPTSGYALPSGKATTFDVVSLDADGNAIIGPGSPAITAAQATGSVTISEPTTPSPGQFIVSALFSASLSTGSFTVTVTPAADSGAATITQTIPVSAQSSHFYAFTNCGASISGPCLEGFTPGTAAAVSMTATTGIANVNIDALATDPSGDVTLGLADYTISSPASQQTLWAFAGPSHAPTGTQTLPAGQYLSALTADLGGNVYVATVPSVAGDGYLLEYPFPNGAFTRSIDLTNGGEPVGLATDGVGNVYVYDVVAAHVLEFGPTGTAPVRTYDPTQVANFSPLAITLGTQPLTEPIAVDLGGDLYIGSSRTPVGSSAGECEQTRATVQVVEFAAVASAPSRVLPIAEADACTVTAVATDAGGNLYAGLQIVDASGTSGAIEVYAPGATSPTLTIPLPTVPTAIATDPSGDLIVREVAAPFVQEVTAGSTRAQTVSPLGGIHAAVGFGP